MISNNQDAEILARVTSLVSENDPSTKAATELVLKDVELLGISSVDNAITDASGLSRSNKISPSDLSEIIYKSIKNPVITKVNKVTVLVKTKMDEYKLNLSELTHYVDPFIGIEL